jgi:hypothetical protein
MTFILCGKKGKKSDSDTPSLRLQTTMSWSDSFEGIGNHVMLLQYVTSLTRLDDGRVGFD